MTQVDRLETLLARVQENRERPRAASPDALAAKQVAGSPMAPVATVAQRAQQAPQASQHVPQAPQAAPSRAADARPAKPAAAPNAAQAAPRAQTTPLEMALEGRVSSPAGQPPKQPPPAAPVSYEGRVLVDPQPAAPGRPIAQVVSMHPPSQALTFGELLRRSLSLRPR